MKKLLMLILSAFLIFSMFSCGEPEEEEGGEECTEHIDADGNSICDKCYEYISNSEGPTEVSVVFTVKDRDEKTLPGVTVTLTAQGGEDVIVKTSDSNGEFTATLATGSYSVSYDYSFEELGYYLTDTARITVEKTTESLGLYLINNNPDGTLARPFALSVGENELSIPAGESYYYIVYRAVNLLVDIESPSIKVTYGSEEYTPDSEGLTNFDLLGQDTNSAEVFKIENVTDEDVSITLTINSRPGTIGNPHVIAALGEEISITNITSDDIVYYKYTATAAGTFTLTMESEDSYIAMVNSRNSVATNTSSSVGNTITLTVEEGDEIIIDCATTLKDGGVVTFVPLFDAAE